MSQVEVKVISESDVRRRINRTQDALEDAGFTANDVDLIVRSVDEYLILIEFRKQRQDKALLQAKKTINPPADTKAKNPPPPDYDDKEKKAL